MTVAQIVTFGTLQARAAIRDVGRVLGMSFGDVDRIAKLVPEVLGITLSEAIDAVPELRARMDSDGQVKQLIETALSLEGLTRHASKHAAGVVIGNKPLIEMVPLYRDPKSGDVMSQYNMNCVEKVGLIKFDFLGLRTLTVMADAEAMIRAQQGPEDFRYERDPARRREDLTTCCAAGDTEGVFQVESSGHDRPRHEAEAAHCFDDRASAHRALSTGAARLRHGRRLRQPAEWCDEGRVCHPGARGGHRGDPRRHRATRIRCCRSRRSVAGYSLGEADLLRRAMGKKKPKRWREQRERFVDGAAERNIDEKKAATLFDLISEFAAYGFPKAHSVAYALIVYQTAYLKANHPHEFLAAVLTIESSNHDKLSRYIAHCRERGIAILPPDVNESARTSAWSERRSASASRASRTSAPGAIEHILEARGAGAFASLFDFVERVDGRKVNRRVVEALVKCGAFDSLHDNRNSVWCSLDAALERGAAVQRDAHDRAGEPVRRFHDRGARAGRARSWPRWPPWTDRERSAPREGAARLLRDGPSLGEVAPGAGALHGCHGPATAGGPRDREVRAGGLLVGPARDAHPAGPAHGLRHSRGSRGQLRAGDLHGALPAAPEPAPACAKDGDGGSERADPAAGDGQRSRRAIRRRSWYAT